MKKCQYPSHNTPNQSAADDPPSVAVIGGGYWGKNLIRNFYDLNSLKLVVDKNESILSDFKNHQERPSRASKL